MRSRLLIWIVLGWLAAGFCGRTASSQAVENQSLDELERQELGVYLQGLKAGQPGSAAAVDRLADLPFGALREVMEAYAGLEKPIEGHTHWGFQALLERMGRTALLPRPVVTMYSSELGDFLTGAPDHDPDAAEDKLPERLFERLVASGVERRPFDLAVTLTPGPALRYLAQGESKAPHRAALLQAWNRRLARGNERRPIHELDRFVQRITRGLVVSAKLPPGELEAHLRFVSFWPAQQDVYREKLSACLASTDPRLVEIGLAVQQHAPLLVELNEPLLARFPSEPKLRQAAIHNFAVDDAVDHSAELRRIWAELRPEESKERYNCLLAMGVHHRGNDEIALAAVLEQPFAYLDVAMPVLEHGKPEYAERAIRYILGQSQRGHEEALRLARRMRLAMFADDAVRIAADKGRDQVLRQTAMLYLQLAAGKTRRRLLAMLADPNGDLRLAAIQMFATRDGLTPEDMDDIGPALIRVAQADPSMGHRQEAAFSLGQWQSPETREFFQQMLVEHPPAQLLAGHYNDEHYWRYRLRLVSLAGLARLGDRAARDELLELHRTGGPTERMDVLLAFVDLGEVVPAAFDDLRSLEPKLVATAAHLIHTHGNAADRERLRRYVAESPLWLEFRNSGIDDHNILEMAGVGEEGESGRGGDGGREGR